MVEDNIVEAQASPNISEPVAGIWRWLFGTGIVMLILGLAAIFLPFVATLTIQALLAVIFIIAGAVQIVHAVKANQPKGFALRLLGAALYLGVGILLLAYPFEGALTLTLVLAALFIVAGAFKITLALHVRPVPSWGWILVSGILAILLGVLIWAGLPATARWAIGLLVGIELLFTGWTMIIFAVSVRDAEHNGTLAAETRI